jgi:hypothetical protein
MVTVIVVHALLVTALGIGIWRSADQKSLRLAGVFMVGAGLVGFPNHTVFVMSSRWMEGGFNDIMHMRDAYHAGLISSGTLSVDTNGVASIADGSNRLSVNVAGELARALQVSTERERQAGQTLGSSFEAPTREFVEMTFPAFSMLRPGRWEFRKVPTTRRGKKKQIIPEYEPYRHLADLAEAINASQSLAAMLANTYAISPDIIVTRRPEADEFIDRSKTLIDEQTANLTAIRAANQSFSILHAVISCKWTLRSDRAQNARSEALNLIRNRKGRLPHIVVVTAEPTPSRLSSLALGTGDLDCVYHVALPELQEAMRKHGNDDNIESLETMVAGRRLKDISDLPLDLAV